tara:strand:+ start:141 stop:497 length:357 start_codon:yes stop_codon:yes gene_type:complete
MGGGIFGTPLHLNIKCIIFSISIILIYYLPKPKTKINNIIMVILIATSAYVSMAWYDYIYDCNDKLKPTIFGWFSKRFKPPRYSKEYNNLPIKYKKIIRNIDILLLLFIVGMFIFPYI